MYPLSQSLHTSIYCIHCKNILQIFIMITSIYSCSTQSPLILKIIFLYSNHFVNILPPYQSHVWKLQYEWIKSSTRFFSLWYNWNSTVKWTICVFLIPRGCSTLFEQMSLFSKFTQAYDNFIQSLIEKGPLFTKKKIKTWIK